MSKPQKPPPDELSDSDVDRLVREAAIREGACLPKTEEELTIIEQRFSGYLVEVPSFGRVLDLIHGAEKPADKIIPIAPALDETVVEDLAMAARKGGVIPDEIRKKMDADRLSEEQKKKRRGDG
jgi:hypothetical protein